MPAMQSNYVMTVSQADGTSAWNGEPHYEHLCQIELGSGLRKNVVELARVVAAQFPEPQFRCRLTYWGCSGEHIPLDS